MWEFSVRKPTKGLLRSSRLPVLLFVGGGRGAAVPEAFGDVFVGEVFHDPLGEGQRLDLLRGDGEAQGGAAQVAQAGDAHGRPPEPNVAVPGSVGREPEGTVNGMYENNSQI